ncbi:MAG: polysaccharide deacetylase [Alphaproteobacteria bacterium]|nr:polysaccharide deacetylase [Alphaproteobacteria bacterium]
MPRHIVCLTVDFDALSPFVARGLVSPSALSRGEFSLVGADRLLRLFKHHGVRSTWFTPGVEIDTYPDMARRVVDEGHEMAHHGYTHRPPNTIGRAEEESELVRGNEAIARLTGRRARGYRSPSWELSPQSIELLLRHGFDYESSLMGHDYLPYHARLGDVISADQPPRFGPPTRLVEMPISWTLDDFPHFEYLRLPNSLQPGLMSARAVMENWLDDFLYMVQTADWGVLTYTFHPFVIGRGHRIMMLERLIERMKEGGAVFLRMDEAVDEFLARRAAAA